MLCDEMAPAVNHFALLFISVDYRKYDHYFKIIFQSLKYHISESRNDRGHRPCKKDDRTYSKTSKTARTITLDWRCFGQHRMLLLKSFQIQLLFLIFLENKRFRNLSIYNNFDKLGCKGQQKTRYRSRGDRKFKSKTRSSNQLCSKGSFRNDGCSKKYSSRYGHAVSVTFRMIRNE